MVDIDKDKIEAGTQAANNARERTVQLLQEKGPKLDKVLKRLRDALKAQETKVVKLKGAITPDQLPKGFKLIVNTGLLIEGPEGQQFGTGESLVKYDVVAHGHRLKAVDLALQLHDAMPSQKHEVVSKLDNESDDELDNRIKRLIGQIDANSD